MTNRSSYSTSDAFAHEAFAHEAFAQEAELHDALDHDALDQEAELQDALDQEALDQDAEFHDAFEVAVEYHSSASNSFLPVALLKKTNWFRPAFGLARPEASMASSPSTTPTPMAPFEPYPAGTETVSMMAPLI